MKNFFKKNKPEQSKNNIPEIIGKEKLSPEQIEKKEIDKAIKALINNLLDNPKTIYHLAANNKLKTAASLLGNLTSTGSSALTLQNKNLLNEQLLKNGLIEALTEIDRTKLEIAVNRLSNKIGDISDSLKQINLESIDGKIPNSIVSFFLDTLTTIKTAHPEILTQLGDNLVDALKTKDFTNVTTTLIKSEILEAISANSQGIENIFSQIPKIADKLKELNAPAEKTEKKFFKFLQNKKTQTTSPKLISTEFHGLIDVISQNHSYMSSAINTIAKQEQTGKLANALARLNIANKQIEAADIMLNPTKIPKNQDEIEAFFKASSILKAREETKNIITPLNQIFDSINNDEFKQNLNSKENKKAIKLYEKAMNTLVNNIETVKNVKTFAENEREQALLEAQKYAAQLVKTEDIQASILNSSVITEVIDKTLESKEALKSITDKNLHPLVDIVSENRDYINNATKTLIDYNQRSNLINAGINYIQAENKIEAAGELRKQALELVTDFEVQHAILNDTAIGNIIHQTLSQSQALKTLLPTQSSLIDIATQNKDYISKSVKTIVDHSPVIINSYIKYNQALENEVQAYEELFDKAQTDKIKDKLQYLVLNTIEKSEELKAQLRTNSVEKEKFFKPILNNITKDSEIKSLLAEKNEEKIFNLISAIASKQKSSQNLMASTTNKELLSNILKGPELANLIDQSLPELAKLEKPKGMMNVLSNHREYIANATRNVLSQAEIPEIVNAFRELIEVDSEKSIINRLQELDKNIVSLLNKDDVKNALFNKGLDNLLIEAPFTKAIEESGLKTLPIIAGAINNEKLVKIFNKENLKSKDILLNSLKGYVSKPEIVKEVSNKLILDEEIIKSNVNKAIESIKIEKDKETLKKIGIDGEFAYKIITQLNDHKKLETISKTIENIDFDKINNSASASIAAIRIMSATGLTGTILSHVIKSYISHKAQEFKEHFYGKAVREDLSIKPTSEVEFNKLLLKPYNRPLSKLASVREFEEDSERRTAVYTEVHEDSSTESTYKSPAEVEFRKRPNKIKEIIESPEAKEAITNLTRQRSSSSPNVKQPSSPVPREKSYTR